VRNVCVPDGAGGPGLVERVGEERRRKTLLRTRLPYPAVLVGPQFPARPIPSRLLALLLRSGFCWSVLWLQRGLVSALMRLARAAPAVVVPA